MINLFNKKNLPKALIVIFLILGALIIAFFVFKGNPPGPDNVRINIRIPSSVSSGEEVVLRVDYINDNRIGLKDAYLIIDYPSGTFSVDGEERNHERKDLGLVAKKSKGTEI